MNVKSLFLLICLPMIFSCGTEEDKTEDFIEPELQKYVDVFFKEAERRGVEVDDNNLLVIFSEIEDACGVGNFRRVKIDPDCWSGLTENRKESLMLHELGHAVLRRAHWNTVMPNGLAKSLMCGTGADYEKCGGRDFYSSFLPRLKEFYLDELFDKNLIPPDWAEEKPKENGKILFKEDFENESEWAHVITDTTSSIINEYNFDISFDETLNSNAATIISTEQRQDNVFAFWGHKLNPEDIPEGSVLDLSATISTEQLEGDGASLAFRIDSGSQDDLEVSGFASTQYEFSISGTEQSSYLITIPYTPTEIFSVNLYLISHQNTEGKVSFDDLELTVYD